MKKYKIVHPKKLMHEYKMKVPGNERNDTIDKNNLFAKNPKTYPVPPDNPEATPRIFVGKTKKRHFLLATNVHVLKF